ncbi:MAG: dTDP-glucose 4,6-dehydratase [Clostridiales bacterium]|nr:dTDP-glucose 4,6-dehydratase [Clostridiales bacterium]
MENIKENSCRFQMEWSEIMKNILVTGGAGFIGSNFIRYMLNKYDDYKIINLDLLTYAGNLENLKDVEDNPNYEFIKGDIADKKLIDEIVSQDFDYIVNFAAESHVDRSIEDPEIFVRTNIMGTQVLLDAAKKYNIEKFVQISTDEVYGSLGETGLFTENTPLAPNSPYSASKTSADLLVRAYFKTFNLPVNITRCSNNYGSYQFPEKLIPLMIANALEDKELPVYGDGLQVRDWLHVEDHCSAIDVVLHQGKVGEVYNIGGNNEKKNIEIVKLILEKLGKPESLIKFVKDRPGHDRRYAIDSTKIQNDLGWKPKYTFETGMEKTIKWYLENKEWWEKIRSGEYIKYYEKMYGEKLKAVR